MIYFLCRKMHVNLCLQRPEEDVGYHGPRVTDGCELEDLFPEVSSLHGLKQKEYQDSNTHTLMHMHTHACIRTHRHRLMRTCACAHIHTRACVHTHTHTPTNIHMHFAKLPQCISFCSHIVDTLPTITDYPPYTPNLSIVSRFG